MRSLPSPILANAVQYVFGGGPAGVTSDQNKLVVRRYLVEVINTGNVDRIAEFISPDYVEVYLNTRYAIGLDGARKHVLGVRQTYPDLQVTIEQQIAEGEWVVTRITARGTQRGPWLGIRPTGKMTEITGVNVDRVVNGRIVEHGGAANFLEPLLKTGAIRLHAPEAESHAEPGAPPNDGPATPPGNSDGSGEGRHR